MAQLKDLLVNGDAKVLGTLYTDEIGNNLTIDGGLQISGRVLGAGDDEGLVIGQCDNGFAGVTLGSPSGLRSVFYLTSSNEPVWRFNAGSSSASYDIKHPRKAGTIALTSDIPTSVSINLNGAAASDPSFYAPTTAGTSGQVLKSNGSGAPTWTSLGSNAYTSTSYLPTAGGSMTGTINSSGNINLSAANAYFSLGITSGGSRCYFQTFNSVSAGTDDANLKAGFGFGWAKSLVIDKSGNVEIPGTLNGYTIAQLAANTDTKVKQTAYSTSANLPILTCTTASPTSGNAYETYYDTGVYINHNTKALTATKVYGAVWNDYAEYRNQIEEIKPGYCVASGDDGKVYKTTEKFQACDGIVSDTFGFGIGETDYCKTPLAVAGRVLAYAENPEELHSGDTVCAGPNGKVVKMTREEIREWPDRIVGIVSEIPTYETWGTGGVLVDGRIWIKVK